MAFKIDSKKIVKNTISLYIRQAVTMVISFFATRVTLEQLGVEDYGLNNLVGSIVSMFSFINNSMGTAVQRYYSYEIGRNDQDKLKRVFGVGLYLHIIIAIITFFISEAFAFFFLEKLNIPPERMFAAKVVFQISVLTLVLGIITVPYSALLRARELFSKTALIEIIQAVLRLLNLYLLVVIPFDKLIILSILNFCVSLGGIIAFVVIARRFEETHTGPLNDRELIKEMLKFVSLLLVTVLASVLNTQGVQILVNLFFGLGINAAYTVATQVQNAVNTFVTGFKSSVVPQLMSSYGAKDYKGMHKLINLGTKITFVMLLMITLPIIFSAQWVLTIWLKTPPDNSSFLVILTLISINISSFSYFYAQGIHATGNITKQQIWLSGSYITSVIAMFVLFKLGFQYYTAIYVNMAVGVIQGCVNLIYSKRNYKYSIKYFIKSVFFPCLLITAIIFVILLFENYYFTNEIIKFLIIIGTEIIILPIISFLLLFTKEERVSFISFIENKFFKIQR